MAKYKASPHYDVSFDKRTVSFDINGEYETLDKDEIAALDKLVPTWIKRIDEPEAMPDIIPDETPVEVTTEAAVADAVDKPDETPKPTVKGRKSSGK